jgi:hypothetical protein
MAQTLNSTAPSHSVEVTGPVTILVTEASKFKGGVLDVYMSIDDSADSYSYLGTLDQNHLNGCIATTGDFFVRVDFKSCGSGEVYVDFLETA